MLLATPTKRGLVVWAAYAAGLALMVSAAALGVIQVGTTVLQITNTAIIDGSGKAEPIVTEFDYPSSPNSLAESTAQSPPVFVTAQAPPAGRISSGVTRVSSDNPDHDPAASHHNGAADTYRTYCVRLCDGYYWPISFSTTADRFDRDAAVCNSACGAPARLFVHGMPGGGPGTMVSLEGARYASLKTAFQFRTSYDAQCRCQPQPWEETATDRHRLFAATDAARKGSRIAVAEVKRLTVKVESDRQMAEAARKVADAQASRQLAEIAGKDLDFPRRNRKAAEVVAARPSDLRSAMRLGLPSEEPAGRGRYIPASGSGRPWKDRVFNGN